MRMFLNGEWVDRPQRIEVRNPFDGTVIDTVPQASSEDVATAVSGAVEGAQVMRRLSALERSKILRRVAELLMEKQSAMGGLISREEGKTVAEGAFEVGRAAVTMECSAEEGKRIYGEVLPLDAAPGGANKFGFTLRVPCGVVVAITPFNFPLNLVCHKVGPALAGGNSVIIKPASDTPLSALKLVELLLEAGLPPLAIQCITGGGASVGEALCNDPRVRKVSFTGSAEVGKRICQIAGLKRITMELGSNSPLIVLDDADLNKVAEAVISTGYGNAGQTCISTQRIIATSPVYSALLEALRPKVESIRAGDQLDPQTTMGPMIRERDAQRVTQWIEEAVAGGARLLCGGERQGSLVSPALLADVHADMRISRDELFGPAVGVMVANDIDQAISLANDSRYGLSAGIFTESLDNALKFARQVESGNLHINWGPAWRADLMPYGGLKESGLGREGPKYAIEEMTEIKTVVIHGG